MTIREIPREELVTRRELHVGEPAACQETRHLVESEVADPWLAHRRGTFGESGDSTDPMLPEVVGRLLGTE